MVPLPESCNLLRVGVEWLWPQKGFQLAAPHLALPDLESHERTEVAVDEAWLNVRSWDDPEHEKLGDDIGAVENRQGEFGELVQSDSARVQGS